MAVTVAEEDAAGVEEGAKEGFNSALQFTTLPSPLSSLTSSREAAEPSGAPSPAFLLLYGVGGEGSRQHQGKKGKGLPAEGRAAGRAEGRVRTFLRTYCRRGWRKRGRVKLLCVAEGVGGEGGGGGGGGGRQSSSSNGSGSKYDMCVCGCVGGNAAAQALAAAGQILVAALAGDAK